MYHRRNVVGAALRATRIDDNNHTQATVAERIGAHRTVISDLEAVWIDRQRKGFRALRTHSLVQLAKYIDVPVKDVVQAKVLVALSAELERRRLAAGLSLESMAVHHLDGILTADQLRMVEKNTYPMTEPPVITLELLAGIATATAWWPTAIRPFDVRQLPRRTWLASTAASFRRLSSTATRAHRVAAR